MTVLAPVLVQSFKDNNGNPLFGGQLFSYQAGTTTPLATYTDSTGGTPNANPTILNARGEANIWIPPNTAYKFVLEDSAGNTIWTVDNVTSASLITLYGGVDVGVANAYSLTFTANFSALTNGILLNWIPSNTNTGASTINVNSLGVVAIVNPNGAALASGQLIAGQPAQIFYYNGSWILMSSYVLRTTVTLNAGSVGANSFSTTTTTVNGAQTGNAVVITPQSAGNAELIPIAFVSAPNTVTYGYQNPQSGSIVYTSMTFNIRVLQ